MSATENAMRKARFFRLSPLFSAVSLVSVVVTAVVLAYVYRYVAVNAIIDLGEQNNVLLSQAALNAIRDELIHFLQQVDEPTAHAAKPEPAIPPDIEKHLLASMDHTSVVRIKIYDKRGRVVYSTKASQVGDRHDHNPGFLAAMKGGVKSKLIYRDTFNVFDQEGEEDNLIQTYLPVTETPWGPVFGVFEVYTNVQPVVDKIERTEFLMASWVAAVLFALYVLLLFVVHRSERIIDRQRDTILERSRTLEWLSARMLSAEERERAKISTQLHEGVAQHLSAIKLRIEHLCRGSPTDQDQDGEPGVCDLVVPEVQKAIQDVRAMAMDIHPPSLDDFGLLPTVSWLKNEFMTIYPAMQIESRANVQEREIPIPMKAILFRIIQEALEWIAKRAKPSLVRIEVGGSRDELTLSIEHDGAPWPAPESEQSGEPLDELELGSIRQRTVLSGGVFQLQSEQQGWNRLYASWGV